MRKLTNQDIINAILYRGCYDSQVGIYAAGLDKDGNIVLEINFNDSEEVTSVTMVTVKQRRGGL